MYSHHPKQQQSILSRSLPPTPTQLHHPDLVDDDDDGLDDYLADQDDVPLPFLIKTIVADPQTGLSLTLVSALGAGSYAVVYLAKEVASGTLYALKCLGKDKLTDEEVGIQRNEVVIHTSLPKHRNIVHLFNMFETTDHLFLLLEYCSGMDMYQWISMRSDRSDPVSGEAYSPKARFTVIKSIFDQALEGVAQVHQRGIAHRDLKPENFLVEFVDGQYIVKLTDFGLATTDSESDEFECGSKPYMSFECRNGVDAVYDVQKADMWSLGIILINLLYHRCPWSDPCPQNSFAFSEFLKSRVDFLQRRFEDMNGPVARWLGLQAFAFVGPRKFKRRRHRPDIHEWKTWMVDFVPRMLGHADSSLEADDDYDDQEEYREYVELYENDNIDHEVEGDEIIEDDESDDNESDNQVVPISIHSASLKDKQHLNADPGRAYASYHVPMDAKPSSTFAPSSVPKFDPSSFYQPTHQASWSDAMDMEETEDSEMDFNTPLQFNDYEDDDVEVHVPEFDNEDDLTGLAVALPDDFIDPLPERSAVSSGRQTPSTPTPNHLNFNTEKRQLPPHLRSELDSPNHQSPESSRRSAGRGSPGLDLNDLATLVFIEPDNKRPALDSAQNTTSLNGHAIASSMPSTGHMEASLGPGSTMNKDRAVPKQQMRKPARNLQDVKAAPFVFPPLKTSTLTGISFADGTHSSTTSPQKEKPSLSQQIGFKEMPQKYLNKPTLQSAPKKSQLGSWATGSGFSARQGDTNASMIGRHSNKNKSHHRGGSWTSMDDFWENRKDGSSRNGAKTGSGRWRAHLDREDGHAGLPPRVENKFRPRYRQGRRFPPNPNSFGLPPAPPIQHSGSSAPRSRHHSRSGTAFDTKGAIAPTNNNDSYQKQDHHQSHHSLRYENTPLRAHHKANSTSRLASQRNKSMMDLRAAGQSWRQPAFLAESNNSTSSSTMIKSRSQAGADDPGRRRSYGPNSQSHDTSEVTTRSRLSGRVVTADEISKDNVYHPPHWHERHNSGSSASSRRPISGYESDFTGWQKQDGNGSIGFSSKNRTASKGRLGGPFSSPISLVSTSMDRKQGQTRPADSNANWRAHDRTQANGSKRSDSESSVGALGTDASSTSNSPTLIKGGGEATAISTPPPPPPPVMTLTPSTPNVNIKSEFISSNATSMITTTATNTSSSRTTDKAREKEASETKKIVKPGAMTGLSTMLRGLVAYNKNIKVGGEARGSEEHHSSPERRHFTKNTAATS